MSLANDQNCATSDMLKMPTQMKNATPTYGTRAATATANSSMLTRKNSETPTSSLTRGGVRPQLCPATQENERLAHRLDDGVADQQQEDVQKHQQSGDAFTCA